MNAKFLTSVAGAAAVALFGASAANAQALDGVTFQADAGYSFVGVDAGEGGDLDLGAITVRGSAFFNDFFGAEAEVHFGVQDDDVEGTDIELSNAYGIFAVGQIPLENDISLHGRVGYFSAELDAEGFGSDDEDGIAIGVGGKWYPQGNRWGVRGDYTRFEADDADADIFSIALTVKLGG